MGAKKGAIPWNKGIPCLKKTKEKLRLSTLGRVPWNKGIKTGRPSWNRGIPCSEEQKNKLSEKLKGKRAWNKGVPCSEKTKEKLSESLKGNANAVGCTRSKETREKISQSKQGSIPWLKGRHHTEEAKAKLSLSRQGIEPWIKGREHTDETKAKISCSKKGRGHTEKTRVQMSSVHKEMWQDTEYKSRQVQAIMTGMNVKPNKPETIILMILEKLYPKEWGYVGDGKVVLGGLIPDIINVNGKKKIIEMFGDYWHSDEKVGDVYHRSEEGRKEAFAAFGFATLVIWENELDDMEAVVEKIREFAG